MTKKVVRSATLRDPVVVPPKALVGSAKRRYPMFVPESHTPEGASPEALTASAPSPIVMLSRLTEEERQALADEMLDFDFRHAAAQLEWDLEDDPISLAARALNFR